MLNVILLGLVSFFADISSEMIYPILPLYLSSVLGASPALVGVIEGIAESMASLLKVFGGYISDKYHNKKFMAFTGYSASVIYKIALLLAGSWTGVLVARVIDRVGKGIRTAPRDVMISESAKSTKQGYAFGVHKAMDMAGSAIGILFAFLLLKGVAGDIHYRTIFWFALIPSALSLMMFFFIKEKRAKAGQSIKQEPFWKNLSKVHGQLRLYLLVTFLFSLGNSSNAFLLLRAKSIGFDDGSVVMLYFIYSLTASILSIPMGRRSDQIGRKRILAAGYLLFTAVYACFAFNENKALMIGIFVLYGIYTAMISGVERAYISDISPSELKGTMLGLQSTVAGIALLPASIITGVLWTTFGPRISFLFGAVLSLSAALLLIFLMKEKDNRFVMHRE